ncbi:MAG: hypothetical protein MUD01_15525 [Chloroflexaceae bacterium]|nr:hypothetical protein [Chloroflexaceae bacterium]
MSYRQRVREPRKQPSCLSMLLRVGIVLALLVLLYVTLIRPQISAVVGQLVGRELAPPGGASTPNQPTTSTPLPFPTLAPTAAGDAISRLPTVIGTQTARLPTVVAALPRGEVAVTDKQINDYIAANPQALEPLEGAVVRFVPGEIQADLMIVGITSTARSGLAVKDGRIVLVNPQLDGALGLVVSAEEVSQALEEQVNALLVQGGQTVRDVRIEQGKIVATIE